MTSEKIRRSQVQSFLNTNPGGAANYELIGDGVTAGAIKMNPKTTQETYIHQDSGSTSVDSYSPNMPVEGSAKKGDPAFDYIDGLRKNRSVLGDCETDIVNVWLYETPAGGEYPAERQPVSLQVDEFGGAGGEAVKISYTVNYNGPSTPGTFNPITKAFTPD